MVHLSLSLSVCLFVCEEHVGSPSGTLGSGRRAVNSLSLPLIRTGISSHWRQQQNKYALSLNSRKRNPAAELGRELPVRGTQQLNSNHHSTHTDELCTQGTRENELSHTQKKNKNQGSTEEGTLRPTNKNVPEFQGSSKILTQKKKTIPA